VQNLAIATFKKMLAKRQLLELPGNFSAAFESHAHHQKQLLVFWGFCQFFDSSSHQQFETLSRAGFTSIFGAPCLGMVLPSVAQAGVTNRVLRYRADICQRLAVFGGRVLQSRV